MTYVRKCTSTAVHLLRRYKVLPLESGEVVQTIHVHPVLTQTPPLLPGVRINLNETDTIYPSATALGKKNSHKNEWKESFAKQQQLQKKNK